MSVVQRGLRSSTRSKAVVARVRDLSAAEAPKAAMPATARRLPPLPHGPVLAQAVLDLTEDQQAAAEQLAEVFAAAEFETWARGGPGSEGRVGDPLQPSCEALIARAAYCAAMRAVPVMLSPLIVHVCCLGLPLTRWADEKRLPRAQVEAALRTGLNHLILHFRRLASA